MSGINNPEQRKCNHSVCRLCVRNVKGMLRRTKAALFRAHDMPSHLTTEEWRIVLDQQAMYETERRDSRPRDMFRDSRYITRLTYDHLRLYSISRSEVLLWQLTTWHSPAMVTCSGVTRATLTYASHVSYTFLHRYKRTTHRLISFQFQNERVDGSQCPPLLGFSPENPSHAQPPGLSAGNNSMDVIYAQQQF